MAKFCLRDQEVKFMDSRMRNRVSRYVSEDLLCQQEETVFEQIAHRLSFPDHSALICGGL